MIIKYPQWYDRFHLFDPVCDKESEFELDGKKFRRQHSVGNYILDFYCPAEKIAIELDGMPHFSIIGEKKIEKERSTIIKMNQSISLGID